jgi:glutamate N-acetyltransferase/amino-acid N-acetyltransferase
MNEPVLLPSGILAAGHACGIKADPQTLDLALFVSETPCTAVGVFTQNRVVGAPVKVNRSRVPRSTARAVVLNSGNSNSCTGERGVEDARRMTAEVARGLRCDPEDVLVCSTGVIGQFLPMEKLVAGIPRAVAKLAATPEAFHGAARGMMTTDTFPKQAMRRILLGGRPATISGACKGAAMIAPNMATMLAVVMTDLDLAPGDAGAMLREAVDDTFNCVSIDGHMSTSDTVLLLANGASGAAPTSEFERLALRTALTEVCAELAQMMVRDAEGAAHFVTIDVAGLRTRAEARCIAKAVAESALVKTAIAGNDPNWGRIVSAAGYAGVPFAERDCSLAVNGIVQYESGAPTDHDPQTVSEAMRSGQVHIELQFTLGKEAIRYWTSDLTTEYVRLNSEYTT